MSITLPGSENETPQESNAIEAVEYCVLAWNEAFGKQIAKEKDEYAAARYAHKAFREAMPNLTSSESIQAFIACVSRGILIGAIDYDKASKLLYAAQVARQAANAHAKLTRQPRAKKPVQPETAPAEQQAIA